MPFLFVFATTFAVFAWAILWRNSSLLIPTRRRGSRRRRQVALTFDDGPDARLTPVVLDALERCGVKATFFCIGETARREPELLRRIHRHGHLLANHSHEHDWRMNFWHPNRVARSMVLCGRTIERATGCLPRFYRPPVGIKSPAQALMGWKLGLEFVGWTRSARDGGRRLLDAKSLARLARTARAGDVILLHDGKPGAPDASDTVRQTAAIYRAHLPELIRSLRARGLEPVRLDELLQTSGVQDEETRPDRKSVFVKGIFANLGRLARRLAREHVSPGQLAIGVGVGVFIGCTPLFGLHALLGLVAAIKLRLNKLAVFLGTNITNPLTGPLVILANIQAGCRMLTGQWLPLSPAALDGQSFLSFSNRLMLYWVAGFPVATPLLALLAATLCYPVLYLSRTRKHRDAF